MPTSGAISAIKVLLVEDDEDDAIITQALLEQSPAAHYELDWARSYDAGLSRIKERQYDIGLLDYNLGSKTGIEFLGEAHSANQHAPIIMLTGQGNESLVLQALESGAIDYLPKRNMSSENLQRTISHNLEKIRLQDELVFHQGQLEETNRQLNQRTEEMQRFYRLLTHELTTPLIAASECMDSLLEGIPGPLTNEQTHYLQLIQGCCAHLDRNIHDLYEMTRLETGELRLAQQPTNLAPLITDVLHSFAPKAKTKQISLHTSLSPQLPHVMMDVHRIRQVLSYLLDNALKFTERAGKILIKAYTDPFCPDRVRVSIKDTGVGIPQSQLSGIFERLYQVEQDPSATFRGLGLGLFICRELVKLHQGTMSVTSTVGQGSTFSFTLRCSG